jgi:glutathione peroxidase
MSVLVPTVPTPLAACYRRAMSKRSTAAALALVLAACAGSKSAPRESIHQLTVVDIDGKSQPLAQYQGKVLLIVNVASKCGFTPQYAGLEQLWKDYKDRGLVVLGFPSNEFAGQEPGAEPEIKKFCSTKYNVSFPMFAKVKTHGDDVSPLYAILDRDGRPRWNFYKYVVGKDGKVREMFSSFTKPDAQKLRTAIDAALAE